MAYVGGALSRHNPNSIGFLKYNPEPAKKALIEKFKQELSQWTLEKELGKLVRLPSDKKAKWAAYVEEKIQSNDAQVRQAYQFWKAWQDLGGLEDAMDSEFKRDFIGWLQGKGKPEHHNKTPWFRNPAMMDLPDVRWWLESFIDEKKKVEVALLKLVLRTPRTLNECWLYFKYVLNDGWKHLDDELIFVDFDKFIGDIDNPGGSIKEDGSIEPDGNVDDAGVRGDKTRQLKEAAENIEGSLDKLLDRFSKPLEGEDTNEDEAKKIYQVEKDLDDILQNLDDQGYTSSPEIDKAFQSAIKKLEEAKANQKAVDAAKREAERAMAAAKKAETRTKAAEEETQKTRAALDASKEAIQTLETRLDSLTQRINKQPSPSGGAAAAATVQIADLGVLNSTIHEVNTNVSTLASSIKTLSQSLTTPRVEPKQYAPPAEPPLTSRVGPELIEAATKSAEAITAAGKKLDDITKTNVGVIEDSLKSLGDLVQGINDAAGKMANFTPPQPKAPSERLYPNPHQNDFVQPATNVFLSYMDVFETYMEDFTKTLNQLLLKTSQNAMPNTPNTSDLANEMKKLRKQLAKTASNASEQGTFIGNVATDQSTRNTVETLIATPAPKPLPPTPSPKQSKPTPSQKTPPSRNPEEEETLSDLVFPEAPSHDPGLEARLRELDTTQQEIDKNRGILQQIYTEINTKDNALKKITEAIKEKTDELGKAKEDADAARNKLRKKLNKVDEETTKLGGLRESLKDAEGALEALKEVQSDLGKAKKQKQELQGEIAAMQADKNKAAQYKGKLKVLKTQLAAQEELLEKLQDQKRKFGAQASGEDIAGLKAKLKAKEKAVKDLQTKSAQAEDALTNATAHIDKLNGELTRQATAYNSEAEKYKEAAKAQQELIDRLSGAKKALEDEKKALNEANKQGAAANAQQERKIAELENANAALQQQMNALQNQTQSLAGENAYLKDTMSQLQPETQNLKGALDQASQDRNSLVQQMQGQSQEMERLRQALEEALQGQQAAVQAAKQTKKKAKFLRTETGETESESATRPSTPEADPLLERGVLVPVPRKLDTTPPPFELPVRDRSPDGQKPKKPPPKKQAAGPKPKLTALLPKAPEMSSDSTAASESSEFVSTAKKIPTAAAQAPSESSESLDVYTPLVKKKRPLDTAVEEAVTSAMNPKKTKAGSTAPGLENFAKPIMGHDVVDFQSTHIVTYVARAPVQEKAGSDILNRPAELTARARRAAAMDSAISHVIDTLGLRQVPERDVIPAIEDTAQSVADFGLVDPELARTAPDEAVKTSQRNLWTMLAGRPNSMSPAEMERALEALSILAPTLPTKKGEGQYTLEKMNSKAKNIAKRIDNLAESNESTINDPEVKKAIPKYREWKRDETKAPYWYREARSQEKRNLYDVKTELDNDHKLRKKYFKFVDKEIQNNTGEGALLQALRKGIV